MKFQHVENEEYMTQSNRVDRVYILIKLRRDRHAAECSRLFCKKFVLKLLEAWLIVSNNFITCGYKLTQFSAVKFVFQRWFMNFSAVIMHPALLNSLSSAGLPIPALLSCIQRC